MKIHSVLLIVLMLSSVKSYSHTDRKYMSETTSIGQRYLDLIRQFTKDDAHLIFSSDVKNVINSKVICNNRNELISQMSDIIETFGVKKIELLELIVSSDKVNVIRFEITYGDDTTESYITIIKCNDEGLIEEINEVFAEKGGYQWQSQA